MHSPTLFILSAVLMALVSTVLCAVWHFNKQIPGLRLWTPSYSLGFLACLSFLVRDHLPEPLSVLLTQGTMLWGPVCTFWAALPIRAGGWCRCAMPPFSLRP